MYHKVEDGDQVQIFNGMLVFLLCSMLEFLMFSQTSGRVFAMVSGFLVPFILMTYIPEAFTFKALKYLLILICFIFDIVSIVCSYLIPADFIPGPSAKINLADLSDGNARDRMTSSDIGLNSLLDELDDRYTLPTSKQVSCCRHLFALIL